MKKFLVATMALTMLAGSATAALAGNETPGTLKGVDKCASHAAGTNLQQSATAGGATSISVAWSDWCDGEDAYHVYASNGSGGWNLLTTTTGTAYSHTGLVCETTYTYKLAAEKYGNPSNGGGGKFSESAAFTGSTGTCPAEGKAAPAISNEYLRTNAAAAAACEARYDGANNWHGRVTSAVAHEFEGQTFTPAQESVVTDWVDAHCAAATN